MLSALSAERAVPADGDGSGGLRIGSLTLVRLQLRFLPVGSLVCPVVGIFCTAFYEKIAHEER